MKKTPLKKTNSSLRKSPLKKISHRGVVKKQEKKKESSEIHEAMYQFWLKNPHICSCCDRFLGNEFSLVYIDHLLEKSVHKEFSKDERNMFMVCFTHHQLKTNGFPHPKHKEAIEKAKKILLGGDK